MPARRKDLGACTEVDGAEREDRRNLSTHHKPEVVMVAIVSLVVGLFLARYVSSLKSVVLYQAALYVLASVVLVTTAPNHGSTHAIGLLLSVVLAPLTALVVLLGRIWRNRSTVVASPAR